MLGKLEIDRLRQLAEDELGDGFDVRDFHDRVLENGAITLPMLEQRISDWIKAKKLMAEDEAPEEAGPDAE